MPPSSPPDDPDDDAEVFRTAMRGVEPHRCDRAPPHHHRPHPRRLAWHDVQAPEEQTYCGWSETRLDAHDGPNIASDYLRPGVQRRVLSRLRRGKFDIQGVLDLHGKTAARAKAAVQRFITARQGPSQCCVLIIHGKGLSSGDSRPVLPSITQEWLRLQPAVLAFCTAQPRHGGTGAVYVLLRRGNQAE